MGKRFEIVKNGKEMSAVKVYGITVDISIGRRRIPASVQSSQRIFLETQLRRWNRRLIEANMFGFIAKHALMTDAKVNFPFQLTHRLKFMVNFITVDVSRNPCTWLSPMIFEAVYYKQPGPCRPHYN